ncbi:hypothetical protein Fleli_2853 [Bernardetia litoralis DSM 6794]|uniref:Glycosyltransferase n=1 Tax=Bernardetia litoralis (strain ATCC 23117 / DSM 6794 / NBRC 15988 / NCIMB 1366 / Fx l1 / Sio-4) TaxID=880071 RepID=I4AMM1_BERLS|nr:hypothetical protein [Bernardetia litoralis]AFM05206.1 hypothetical protein Fleli_2853 [Bernardetia litoralis DSM 6794]
MIKIALLELGGSHDECLYSQIKCLKSIPTVHITLICDSKVAQNTIDFDKDIDTKIIIEVFKGIAEWKQMYKLSNFLLKEKFDKIILNTAQSSKAKKLCFFVRQKIEVYGILHNIQKLHGSIGQKIISQSLKGYFVLNDYLLEKIPKTNISKFSSFYTIFFPKNSLINLSKPADEIWICIPGKVEEKRRDYDILVQELSTKKLSKHIKFIFLGKIKGEYALTIKQKIEALGLESQFMYWEDFVPNQLFHSILQESDFIMPLIHSNHISASYYEYRISGTFNLAFAYQKPLLIEQSFEKYTDFKNNSVSYVISNLLEVINNLQKIDSNLLYKEEKWSFEFQKKKYLDFIFNKN